jgi:hypothetical protein
MPNICSQGTPCEGPFNCIDRVCVDPAPSCDHHKAANPNAGDGLYWINPAGTPMRAYCDMEQRLELCTDVEAEHHGVLRDASKLKYTMTSVLSMDGRTCEVWAVRDSFEQIPISTVSNAPAGDSCTFLGFGPVVALGSCGYGTGSIGAMPCGDCGFGGMITSTAWSNYCCICTTGARCSDGCGGGRLDVLTYENYEQYVRVNNGGCLRLMSSFDGQFRTSCRVVE